MVWTSAHSVSSAASPFISSNPGGTVASGSTYRRKCSDSPTNVPGGVGRPQLQSANSASGAHERALFNGVLAIVAGAIVTPPPRDARCRTCGFPQFTDLNVVASLRLASL